MGNIWEQLWVLIIPHAGACFCCLLIYLFSGWLGYFSEACLPYCVKPQCDVAPQRLQPWACAHAPGMTAVLVGFSLTVFSLTTPQCWVPLMDGSVVFSNALGCKFLHRLIQLHSSSSSGTAFEVMFEICPSPKMNIPFFFPWFLLVN